MCTQTGMILPFNKRKGESMLYKGSDGKFRVVGHTGAVEVRRVSVEEAFEQSVFYKACGKWKKVNLSAEEVAEIERKYNAVSVLQ